MSSKNFVHWTILNEEFLKRFWTVVIKFWANFWFLKYTAYTCLGSINSFKILIKWGVGFLLETVMYNNNRVFWNILLNLHWTFSISPSVIINWFLNVFNDFSDIGIFKIGSSKEVCTVCESSVIFWFWDVLGGANWISEIIFIRGCSTWGSRTSCIIYSSIFGSGSTFCK